MGMLRFNATVDLSQFWPNKRSDADTMHAVPVGPIMFEAPGKAPKAVTVFKGAWIKQRKVKDKMVPVPVLGASGFSIRVQGVDAPELHYTAQDMPSKKKLRAKGVSQTDADFAFTSFRQPFGERATAELLAFLKPHAKGGVVSCVVESRVQKPNDTFDRYGRMLGEVTLIKKDHQRQSINEWLVLNGWALPAFYDSMFPDEIDKLLTAENAAGKKGMFGKLDNRTRTIDFKLIERKNYKGKPDALVTGQRDSLVVMPKLFRRLTTWSVKTRIGLLSNTFQAFLSDNAKKRLGKADCRWLSDFLKRGKKSPKVRFASLIRNGRLTAKANELVIVEDPTTLKGPNGKPITSWK